MRDFASQIPKVWYFVADRTEGLDNGEPHATLPSSFHGVVFIDEDGSKKILLRQTQESSGEGVCFGVVVANI